MPNSTFESTSHCRELSTRVAAQFRGRCWLSIPTIVMGKVCSLIAFNGFLVSLGRSRTLASSPVGPFDKPPGRLLRFFFKVPVWLHRIGLGGWERVVGAQWMLITTTGRKSGKRRNTMVDVMDHDIATDTYYIEAAYGERADWYKNMQSHPVFDAQVGRRKFKARAGAISADASGEMLVQFYRDKPFYTKTVMAMAGVKFKNEDELRSIASTIMLLSIKPEPE